MANDSPKAAPSAPERPYPFPPPPPPESYPPFPAEDANGAAPPPGTPYMFPYPPTPGMFYTFPPPPQSQSPSTPSSASRPKRSQVKVACTNCAKASKRCDDQRPCLRCQKYSMTDTCVDGQRKERKKGVKHGPYRRRAKDGDSLPASESFTAEVGASLPAAEWTASHGPAPAAAAPSAPAPPAPPASAAAPQPFSALPQGYPHAFYPPMGFLLGPPLPSAEGGAAPVPYFYPYPPFGMYPPPVQAAVPAAADTKTAEEEKKWKRGKGKTNGVNAVGTNKVNGNGASADAGEGAANRKTQRVRMPMGTRVGTPEH